MASLMGLISGNILELNTIRYKLLGVVGGGGSSIVYMAKPVGVASSSHVMVKEFFPHGFDIMRVPDGPAAGSLIVPPAHKDRFSRIMKRVAQESIIAKSLRNDRAGIVNGENAFEHQKTNSPWLIEYSDPIEANGTVYTVIDTKSGETLKGLMHRRFFENKDFVYICDCIKKILDALEHIHMHGYLHLDIAPDNIFVPEYKAGFSEVMHVHLLDFNSALKKGTTPDDWLSSYKEGYTAPELYSYSTKPADLDDTADLYSVAAIFFELLVDKKLKRTDRGSFNSWKITQESGSLEGATNLLVDATNEFLLRGIEKVASCRFQSVTEMRDAVENLITLSKRKILCSGQRFNPAFGHFVGMSDYIEQIDIALENSNHVYIEGVGGIGKTELAKKYADDNSHKFDIIQFVTYDGNLMSTVGRELRFHNYDEDTYAAMYMEAIQIAALNDKERDNKIVEKLFDDKLRFLREHIERILIIVDNYNVASDDHFSRFIPGNYKTIFTSRVEHKANSVVVSGMSDEHEVLALFSRYYSRGEVKSEEVPVILEIGKRVHWHTMTIELLAAALSETDDTIESMLMRLKGGITGIGAYAEIDKQEFAANEREQAVSSHVRNLFCMSAILDNENLAFIMTNMAIAPYEGLYRSDFYEWVLSERYQGNKDEADKDLSRLKKLRWVQFQFDGVTGKQKLLLHAIISDIANDELKPNSETCYSLIFAMVGYAKECGRRTYIEQNASLKMMALACQRINDETDTAAHLYCSAARLNCAIARYDNALLLFLRALAVNEKLPGFAHQEIAAIYSDIAGTYDSMGDYCKALEWYAKASLVYENVPYLNRMDSAAIYNNMALVYFNQSDYAMAMELYNKALVICVNEQGEEHQLAATAYNNMAGIYDRMGNYIKALELYSQALEIRKNLLGFEHPYTANTYNNMAGTYSRLGDYAKALELYSTALYIRERVLGADHPSTAATYNNMASVYNRLGDYDKALELYSKDLDICKKVHGLKHPDTATSLNNIAGMFYNLGEYRKALELFLMVMDIRKDVLGFDHPDTATTYNNMALVYSGLGDYNKALELYAKDLAISEKAFGLEHPSIATNYSNVALTYYDQGKYKSALEWFEKALAIREKALGTGHPETVETYDIIALVNERLLSQ